MNQLFKISQHLVSRIHGFKPSVEHEFQNFSMYHKEGLFRLTVELTEYFKLITRCFEFHVPFRHLSLVVDMQVGHESTCDIYRNYGDQKI